MNKKIYFNHKFLAFTADASQFSGNQSFEIYNRAVKDDIREIARKLTDEHHDKNIIVAGGDFEEYLGFFKNEFQYIEAAGGFIQKSGKYLFIRRHNRWDLPKGKLEKDEEIEHAAVRECQEECGIQDLVLGRRLSPTFHVYAHKKGYALKQTFWFCMQTDFDGQLVPQLEEDITEVRWFTKHEIEKNVLQDTYYTIADVSHEALALCS
jgi:8-oxo-dGTP pyrophosphatase MutT (NUDIX family)